MTAGGTGANEKTLQRDKVPYQKVYLHPGHHAGYYPGATTLHLKVLFAPDTGKLLGAQVVGHDGVDKRIDVLATAMAAGLTVYDLQDLELAYAPPYGSAKDPVNMAGFVASNILKGDLKVWQAEDFPARTAGGVMVDVRGKPAYDAGHVPGALHMPMAACAVDCRNYPRTSRFSCIARWVSPVTWPRVSSPRAGGRSIR
jgi:hypothetical protein